MTYEDYMITFSDDIRVTNGIEVICDHCTCFCCCKFGYHSAYATHKPTGLTSKVTTKLMELPFCHEEFTIASIEDPVDLAKKDLKRKLKDNVSYEKKEETLMKKKDDLVVRISLLTGFTPSNIEKLPDVMRVQPIPLTIEQMKNIGQVKEIGNTFYAFLDSLHNNSGVFDDMDTAKQKIEECVMWAVKYISSKPSQNNRIAQ